MNTTTTFPAEWAPQSGVQLTWPHGDGDWAPDLPEVDACFARLAATISRYEPVLVVCQTAAHVRHVEALIDQAGGHLALVNCRVVPSDDTWARDHGPLTVLRNGAPVLLDFRFNGWGQKYPADQDDAITGHLYAQGVFGATPLESIDLVMEGGSLESDGAGTLLTTSRCLLTPTRNPGHDRASLSAVLQRHLGAKRILWLEHGGIEGDDTDGHIDTLARFCTPDTIAYQACENPDDPHFTELAAMRRELEALRQADGQPYRLVPLPWPRPAHDPRSGKRLPATYANFLIINGAVLLPGYNDPADEIARARLAEIFPGRDIILLDCQALIRGFGSLHCVTMQFPAGVLHDKRDTV